MQIFDENSKRICCCNEALQKGIYTKTFSNDSFCIYGNLMHNKSVLLNYIGKLIDNSNNQSNNKKELPNIYLYYCFDNNWNDKKIINMNVCNQNTVLSYCMIIDIPEDVLSINIAFTNDNDKWDTDVKGTYYLKVYPDIEKSIIKRYGLDSTPPTIISDNLPTSKANIVNIVKNKFISFLSIFNFNRNTSSL